MVAATSTSYLCLSRKFVHSETTRISLSCALAKLSVLLFWQKHVALLLEMTNSTTFPSKYKQHFQRLQQASEGGQLFLQGPDTPNRHQISSSNENKLLSRHVACVLERNLHLSRPQIPQLMGKYHIIVQHEGVADTVTAAMRLRSLTTAELVFV